MYTLYSDQRSGNSYKVRRALARLGIPYTLIETDILKGESRTPEFLAKNPNGQIPLLEVAAGRYISESNAILWYVAGGTPLAPVAHACDFDRARFPAVRDWLARISAEPGHVSIDWQASELAAAT